MDVNRLVYQLRSKVDWSFKLNLLHKSFSDVEARGYASGWNECSSTLNKAKQINKKLFEEDFKNKLEQLRDFICSTVNQKDAVKHIK